MVNTEIELILKWSQNCVLAERLIREAKAAGPNLAYEPRINALNIPSHLKLNITDCKLYVPVVTLQEKYENKLYKGLKNGISFDFEWGRYRTQIINQPVTNNLNFLIDPTFNNVNLQHFYDIPIKNKEQTYKANTELFNHGNYTTGNSLTYEYFCNHYKLIVIDLSKQNSNFKNQQINFLGRLEQNATIFFINEESVTTGTKFEQNSPTIV